MSCQVKSPTSDTKSAETLSYFTRSFRSVSLMGLVTCVACCLWPMSNASAQSASVGDDWAIGTGPDAQGSGNAAATVSVPAPGPNDFSAQPSTPQPSAAPPPPPIDYGASTPGTATPTPPNAAEYEDTDPGALNAFRADLDPYGRWVDDSRYGHVWVPDTQVVGSDFAPYVSNGNWALDADNNWVWESNYPFGGVVFHYGRWVWIDSVGWSWVPGRRYAPAWVVWRVPTDDYSYVGWAPAPPTFVWYDTGLFWLTYYPPMPFVFCPSRYLFYSHFGPYLVHDRRFASTLVNHSVWYSTAPIHGRGYVSPSLAQARVPAYSAPTRRVSANPRAAALANPSSSPRIAGASSPRVAGASSPRVASGTGGVSVNSTARPTWDAHPARTGVPRSIASPTALSSRSFASSGMDSRASGSASYAPRGVRSLGSVPSAQYSPQSSSYSPRYSSSYVGPAPRMSSSGYSAPGRSYYSTSSSGYSAPSRSYSAYSAPSRSYSAPSSGYSAPRYSAPSAPTYSAPHSSFGSSYSAPSRSYSAPSFSAPHSSGGGFHGGGGGGFHGGGGGHHR